MVSLERAKRYLGIEGEDAARDELIQTALDGAVGLIEAAVGRKLGAAEVTELVNGTGRGTVYVSRTPVTDVHEIVLHRSTAADLSQIRRWQDLGAVAVPAIDDVAIDVAGGLTRLDGGVWQTGNRNVQVRYTGGYTDETLPPALRLLILQATALYFRGRGKEGVKSESLSEVSYTLHTPAQDEVLAIPGAQAIIDAHRRIAV